VSCETQVTLTASNYCTDLAGAPSVATFNPIRVWDTDTAAISASATLLCYPDTIVDFQNVSIRNCINQGNIHQRYEYWNFGDYWGVGQDSIVDWTAWPPAPVHTIAYPGIGTYDVMLLDSNFCGIDTAFITIEIVPPPTVQLVGTPDTVCVGELVFLDQTTNGGANAYQWNFGDGAGWQNTSIGDQYYAYATPGVYTASYQANIAGATMGCADTASTTVVVIPAPTASFTLSDSIACEPLSVTFTDNSIDAINHQWDFGNGNTSNSVTPPAQLYSNPGTYTITLTVTNVQGCTDEISATVQINDPPVVSLSDQQVCAGEPLSLPPPVTLTPGDSIINYFWQLGDGTTSTDSAIVHTYAAPGNYQLILVVEGLNCGGRDTANVQLPLLQTLMQAVLH